MKPKIIIWDNDGTISASKDPNDKKDPVMYDWSKDPFALGSYSCYSTTLSSELDLTENYMGIDFKALFFPIEKKLFFAGEHTSILDCIGTMEAAVESGERVSRAIIQSDNR